MLEHMGMSAVYFGKCYTKLVFALIIEPLMDNELGLCNSLHNDELLSQGYKRLQGQCLGIT